MKEVAFYRFLPLSHILSCVTYIVRLINHLPIIVNSLLRSLSIFLRCSVQKFGVPSVHSRNPVGSDLGKKPMDSSSLESPLSSTHTIIKFPYFSCLNNTTKHR
jgi:hypothetical protein